MTDRNLRLALFASITILAATACKKEEEQPPPNQAGMVQPGYQQPGYQQPAPAAQPGYQQPAAAQPAYAQPAPAAAPAAAPAPAAASPTPSPIALACKSDAECIGAKCNVAAGKCQFPCGSNADCQPGWSCNMQLGSVCMMTPGAAK
jgi:hypothetical protein